MEYSELQRILITALFEHIPGTRAEYLRLEAVKSGYPLRTFYNVLTTAHETMNRYVNSKDYDFCGEDENGEKITVLKIIPFDSYTDGRVLDNENITELLQPLADFGAYVFACELANIKPPQDNNQPEHLKCLQEYTAEKLILLHELLIDKLKIERGDPVNNFLFVFGQCEQLKDWQRVNWIGSSPILAALIYKLIGWMPDHKLVNKLFHTEKKYTRANKADKENSYIKTLFNKSELQ